MQYPLPSALADGIENIERKQFEFYLIHLRLN